MKHFINSKIQSIVTSIGDLTRLEDNVWINQRHGGLVYIESLEIQLNPLYGKDMNEFFLFSRPSIETTGSSYKNPHSFRNITLGKNFDFNTILLEGWAYNRYKEVWVWHRNLVTGGWGLSLDSVNLLEYRELTELEYLQIRENLLLNQAGENFKETKKINYDYK